MGNQNTTINNQKDMPQDHQVKEAVPKIGRSLTDGGSNTPGYFTNPAAHLRQPNYMSDDDEILPPRDPYDIPQLRQPAQTGEEDDDDWVIVDHPQGETKQGSLPSKPRPMARSFTVPVKCGTCGDDFQEHINSKSFECLSCSIDKEQRDKEQRQKDYNAFMHPSGSPGTPLSVYDDIDSPLSEDWDFHTQPLDCVSCSIDKVRDFDEELLDKSSNALKIERQLTMARVPDPPVKSCEDESRVRDAEVVYCNQKWFMSGPWRNHPIDKDVADTLLGSRPDNFDEMQKIYDNHVERMKKGEPGADRLEEWQRWQKRLRSDLKCVDEFLHNANSRNIKFAPLWAGTPIGGRQLEGCFRDISVTDTTVKSWAAILNAGPKEFRNPIQEAKDAAKAAKAEESIRRREEQEKADAAYRKQMEHRRIHSESYQRMRKKSEERTNKRRNTVRQMNEMEDHEDFWGIGHENRLDLGYRYGDDREYRAKWENLENQMWDSDSNYSLSCYDWTE